MCGNDDSNSLHPKDIYPSLVELVIHGQDNKLNLFSGFLFFQSILLLAWATVWQMDRSGTGRFCILGLLSLFGSLSSIVWALLETDYANASARFSDIAVEVEKHLPSPYRALTHRAEEVDKKRWYNKGRSLIGFVTWGFALLYPLLGLILWKSN